MQERNEVLQYKGMTVNVAKTIDKTITDHNLIKKNGHVVLGLSGGPDSMCLFHVLLDLREKMDFSLSTVHINHMFRPGSAEKDQDYVEKICEAHDIECYSRTLDINKLAEKRGETSEETGRNERYRAFDEEAERIFDSGIPRDRIVIAVAQNRDDQAETVLMRILRGTGVGGLAGIPYRRKSTAGFDVIRPLLDTDRESIEQYCRQHRIDARIDHTNNEAVYHRNRIRLELLPMLRREYNANVHEALIRLAGSAAADNDYFNEKINDMLTQHCIFNSDEKTGCISALADSACFTEAKPAVGMRMILAVLKRIGLVQGVESVHVEAAYRAIKDGRTGSVIEFPKGYRMEISYEKLNFFRENEDQDSKFSEGFQMILDLDAMKNRKRISFSSGVLTIRTDEIDIDKKNRAVLILDMGKLRANDRYLMVRSRNKGDRMSLKGMKGTKKLQDIFVDLKIPREKRDGIPVILTGNDILWVAGLRDSGKYLADDTTKHCISLEWEPKNWYNQR